MPANFFHELKSDQGLLAHAPPETGSHQHFFHNEHSTIGLRFSVCPPRRRRFAVADSSAWNSLPPSWPRAESRHFQASTQDILLPDIDDKTY